MVYLENKKLEYVFYLAIFCYQYDPLPQKLVKGRILVSANFSEKVAIR